LGSDGYFTGMYVKLCERDFFLTRIVGECSIFPGEYLLFPAQPSSGLKGYPMQFSVLMGVNLTEYPPGRQKIGSYEWGIF
jgi:hypothetical protein